LTDEAFLLVADPGSPLAIGHQHPQNTVAVRGCATVLASCRLQYRVEQNLHAFYGPSLAKQTLQGGVGFPQVTRATCVHGIERHCYLAVTETAVILADPQGQIWGSFIELHHSYRA